MGVFDRILDTIGQTEVPMARRVRDNTLESRAARAKLKARGKPYYKAIGEGLHLGYRKGQAEGKWVVRRYVGNQGYKVETIALADDTQDADGVHVLTMFQAQDKARGVAAEACYVGPYRVRDAFEAYLQHRPTDTANRYRSHILPRLGDRKVDELTADEIRAWLKGLVRGEDEEAIRKSKCSANRVWTVLRAALNLAFSEGKAHSDSEWRRVKPFHDVDRAKVRYLTLEECTRLLNASEPDFRPLVRAALETGCRYGELARLVCADFNPDSGTIHIVKSKIGRGRHVVLTETGQEFFALLVAGRAADEPMFGREWGHDHQTHPMKRACKAARIDGASFHTLRHTWASHAVMGGMPLTVVAHNLGHVDTKMVEKHYGHLAPNYIVDQIRKFAPRFGAVESNVAILSTRVR
jgi:integrase